DPVRAPVAAACPSTVVRTAPFPVPLRGDGRPGTAAAACDKMRTPMGALLRKLLSPLVELRECELTTAAKMFGYSFLVMTAYTSLEPVTRSQFIRDLGADNLPFVQFAFGVLIGLIMQGYAAVVGRLPRRWALPITLGGLVALLVAFSLWFQTGSEWAST